MRTLCSRYKASDGVSVQSSNMPALWSVSTHYFTQQSRADKFQIIVKEYTTNSKLHIDITTLVAGLDKTQEDRTLDWALASHTDKIFGKCHHRARLVKLATFAMEGPGSAEDAAFLKAEKLQDGTTASRFLGGELVQCWVESTGGGGWIAEQVWGFEIVNGERRHTRRVVVWNAGKVTRTRYVYDYKGEGK